MSRVNAAKIRGLFVTGTDTGVGKTIVTAALTAALRAEGINAGVWKPVQSGGLIGSGTTDAERLLKSTGINEPPEAIAPFTYEAPLTPMLAARQAGVTLKLEELIAAGLPLAERYEALLVEGAGGVAVPLTENAIVADLIAELSMPALIVARSGLGTINHTLLTVSFLRQRGIPIVGVVLNDGESAEVFDDPSVAANAELIEQYGGIGVLGRFPRVEAEATAEMLNQTARRTLSLQPIREALFKGENDHAVD
ncbi:dethiobiotin synthase [Paenibacillus herberti]|uniref:ATP-dependent dethiobiotin synthetase BioD n=1 Tax=Paenibacillus herberti TaxID=1619309 RepID=A0A229NZR5_9BACL|nr:dethiobiotin synthase [Paenibacillus herberti]OXM15254.1 dethiobiotin synthase [Paenibacillus herberti]